MKNYFTLFILINTISLFSQNSEQNSIDLSKINLCELTLSELKKQDNNIREVELLGTSFCSNKQKESSIENRKGYVSKLYKGVVFQKNKKTDLISKIKLTIEFKGFLLDGNYIDLSSLTTDKILKKYPRVNRNNAKSCSNYWDLNNKSLYFYVSTGKAKGMDNSKSKNVKNRLIKAIDIFLNCSNNSN